MFIVADLVSLSINGITFFVITQQASLCQMLIFRTDFSLLNNYQYFVRIHCDAIYLLPHDYHQLGGTIPSLRYATCIFYMISFSIEIRVSKW